MIDSLAGVSMYHVWFSASKYISKSIKMLSVLCTCTIFFFFFPLLSHKKKSLQSSLHELQASRDPGGIPTPTVRRSNLQTLRPRDGVVDAAVTPIGGAYGSSASSSAVSSTTTPSAGGVAASMLAAASASNAATALQQQQQRAATAASSAAASKGALGSNGFIPSTPTSSIPAESRIAQLTSTMEVSN